MIFFALLMTHRPANKQIIFTFTTPETIESKQRQGDKRKTIGELINTNEPFCACVDAHPPWHLTGSGDADPHNSLKSASSA